MNQSSVAHGKTHPISGHAVALGQRVKLDPHFLSPLSLQEAGSPVTVEAQIGICEVMDHDDFMLTGEFHHFLEKFQVHHPSRGVVGIGYDEHLWLGPGEFGG